MAKKERKKPDEYVSDLASLEMVIKADSEGASTCFSRVDTQGSGCKFGRSGVCCRICHMGPCRITSKAPLGVCGANADTIVARNYLREVTGGAAAHSDHGRHLVLLLRKVAMGEGGSYKIKDEEALRHAARLYNIEEEGQSAVEVALKLTDLFLEEYSRQEANLKTLGLAPLARQGVWRQKGVEPGGVDRMIVESMHRSTMGVDHDYRSILLHAFRTALADGWGGSRIATLTSDILFGSPTPVRSQANLGVLEEEHVNVVVHGHEPALSEMLALATTDPEIVEKAKSVGAKGVNLAGICCSANEILMRHGIPVAGNFMQQELAIITGAVEMIVTDIQCCLPSLPETAAAYHTEIISTSDLGRTEGAIHKSVSSENAYESAKALLERAIENYKNRDRAKMAIPDQSKPLVAGFSVDAIKYMLGGRFRKSFRPLNDAIIQNRIMGVVGIVGCSNPKSKIDDYTNTLTKELIKRNVLVLKTGCAAIASAKAGHLTPETALENAGQGLREVCEAVGIPPILHMGSCVDNSRILEAATEIVLEGGLGDDLADVPAVGVAPEWMSEKAVAIGCYFVASGVDVILGHPFHISGSDNVTRFMNEETTLQFGASFHVHPDPKDAVEKIVELLTAARKKLGINKKAKRKLMDMKDRRELAEMGQ